MEVAPLLFPDRLDADGVQQRDAQGVDPLLAVEGLEEKDFGLRGSTRTTPTAISFLPIFLETSASVRPTIPCFPSSSDLLASSSRQTSPASHSKMQADSCRMKGP